MGKNSKAKNSSNNNQGKRGNNPPNTTKPVYKEKPR